MRPWKGLAAARAQLEPGLAQQTEPDVCLHVPEQGAWILVEAKFGSPTGAARSEAYFDVWRARYRESCRDLFVWPALDEAKAADVPEQLLRNAAFARHLARDGERAIVVALVREADATPIEGRFQRFCPSDAVEFRRATWESIYSLLPEDAPAVGALCSYFENKTLRLRPAFRLDGRLGRR